MLKYLYQTVRTPHCQTTTFMSQAQRPFVILLQVHSHVTHALVFTQIPNSQIPIVATAQKFKALPSKICSSDTVRMGRYFLDFFVLIAIELLVLGS